jgi:simple sugar transport system ATP-binding protein
MKKENPASPKVSQEVRMSQSSSTTSSAQPIVQGSPASDHPLFRAVDISKHYEGVTALAGVSFEVGASEILALAGENGSGKSTLIRIIAGVERPDNGTLFIDGADWIGRSPIERIEAGIQVIYQDFAVFPNLSAGENIWFPHQLHQGRRLVARSAGVAIAQRVLQEIGVTIELDRPVADLPVSQKQLVAVARALVHDARLLIMDEPTTALTHREVEHLFAIIRRLAARGKSFIFVSHKLQEVAQICDRVVVLRNGSKTLDAPMKDLTHAQIARAMIGREMEFGRYPRAQSNSGAVPLLRVQGFSRAGEYRNINFTLAAGEVLGFAGLMGSGRTSTVKGLFGLPPADHGSIEIDGRPIVIRNVTDAVRAGLAYVPEDRLSEGLFLDFSIEDNIVVRAMDRLISKTGWISRPRKAKEAGSWVERLSIKTPSARLPVSSLSGGNQQRVVLAKWMAANPRVLILNRPTVGIDVGSKPGIHQIIMELSARKVGIIVVSDDLPELMLVCDRVIVMRSGAIVAERMVGESSEEEITQIVTESAP